MKAFEYASPKTVKEAVGLLGPQWGSSEVLAGGTDLLSLMKQYVATPSRLVNIKEIPDLKPIRVARSGVSIGASATLREVAANEEIATTFPSLTTAIAGIASPQIIAMGTLGGDLCQRPRCWYYRSGFGLLATTEGGDSMVTKGDNRYHAILGGGPAYFVSPSSLGPALVALGATVHIAGADGDRELSAADFFRAPESEEQREFALKPNEIVTSVTVPRNNLANATYEVRNRQTLDWPLATCSVALKMDGKSVKAAKIVLGHVAPTPWRAESAEQSLVNSTLSEEVAVRAAKLATRGAKPLSQNSYKVQLAQTAVKRALLAAMG